MKFVTRVLLFLALTGAGSFLLAELVSPLRSQDATKARPQGLPVDEPITLAKPAEQTAFVAEQPPAPVTVPESNEDAASDGKEVVDGKEVLDPKDSKEVIGEGPGRIGGPGSLAPGAIPRAVKGRSLVPPPELPPEPSLTTPP